MNLLFVVYLSVLMASIALGALLSRILLKNPATAKWTAAGAAGVLLAICFLYLLPESLHFFSMAHTETEHATVLTGSSALWVGYGLSLGFLSILSIERYLLRINQHAACSSHSHDEHHHQNDNHDRGTVWPLTLTLCIHSLFDGVALRSTDQSLQIGVPLVFGLVLHKVFETASLMAVLRKGKIRPVQQAIVFFLFVASTPIGLFAAHHVQRIFSQRGAGFLMAFAAGSLLHLLTGHLLPETTETDTKTSKVGVFGLMLAGFFILVVARMFGSEP